MRREEFDVLPLDLSSQADHTSQNDDAIAELCVAVLSGMVASRVTDFQQIIRELQGRDARNDAGATCA